MILPAIPTCALCRQAANFRCLRCGLVFYCTVHHRNEDWERHKPQCRACKVVLSPELGYCLEATRDITGGDIILTETPFIMGPAHFSLSPCCVGCSCELLSEVPTGRKCPQCQWAVCSPNCAKLSDPDGHAVECAMLKLVEEKSSSLLLPYRCMLLQKSNPKMWDWLQDLTSSAVAKQAFKSKHHYAASTLENIASTIFQKNPSFPPLDHSVETFEKIYAVLDAYGVYFWTRPRRRELTGLYQTAGFLQLSCVANTRTDFYDIPEAGVSKPIEPNRVVVTALRNIRQGEILSCSYALSLSSTYFRQVQLASRNMVCRCHRCLDPREMGLHVGTMKCVACPGWVLPVDTLNIALCDWKCDRHCGVIRTATEILERFYYFGKQYEEIAKPDLIVSMNPETMEVMLADLLAELHPNHELCFLVRSILLKTYSSSNLYSGQRSLTDKHLKRRSELCCEMLAAINRLGPNIYRAETIAVITFKECVEIYFEITKKKFPSESWTVERATNNIVNCLVLLERANQILYLTQLDLDMITSVQRTYSDILRWSCINGLSIPENIKPGRFL